MAPSHLLPLPALLAVPLATAPPPPAPPIMVRVAAPGGIATLVRYRAGRAECGGAEQAVLIAEEPFPRGLWQAPGAPTPPWEVTLRFRLDRSGRPHAIEAGSGGPADADERDVPAAFAAWRFAPGRQRPDCRMRFRAELVRVDGADPETLQRYLVFRRVSPAEKVSLEWWVYRRLHPSGQVCANGGLAGDRSVAYPEWSKMGQPAGTFGFSSLRAEVNAAGQPEKVRIFTSSGNAELDRRSIDAVERSRYPPAERRDCAFFYAVWQTAPMQAPPQPRAKAFRTPGKPCAGVSPLWIRAPQPAYPTAFKVRRIEGWAILRYDLSPAGEIADAAVLASEPAAAFGEAALAGLRAGATKPPGTGHRGCILRTEFRMSGISLASGTPRGSPTLAAQRMAAAGPSDERIPG